MTSPLRWRLAGFGGSLAIHAAMAVAIGWTWLRIEREANAPAVEASEDAPAAAASRRLPPPAIRVEAPLAVSQVVGSGPPMRLAIRREPGEPLPEPALPTEIAVPADAVVVLPAVSAIPEPATEAVAPALVIDDGPLAAHLAVGESATLAPRPGRARQQQAAPSPSPSSSPPPSSGTGAAAGSAVAQVEPAPVVHVPPDYPRRARRLGQEGVVVLRITLHADGSVASAVVATSSTSPLLDEAALTAVRAWRYEAGTEGRELPATIRFELR